MSKPKVLVFLDVDGVLNGHHQPSIEGKQVAILSEAIKDVIDVGIDVEIVFNTAWNVRDIGYVINVLGGAGFKYTNRIIGKTDVNSGGGDPVRRWLTKNERIGCRIIIIDDSTRDYNEMWGRLIHCDPKKGFTEADADAFYLLATQPIGSDREERNAAVSNLVAEVHRLAYKTPWLKRSERKAYIDQRMALITHILTMDDFLIAAFLADPDDLSHGSEYVPKSIDDGFITEMEILWSELGEDDTQIWFNILMHGDQDLYMQVVRHNNVPTNFLKMIAKSYEGLTPEVIDLAVKRLEERCFFSEVA